MRCPVVYPLCDQVVTVYHREGAQVVRKVFTKAFFDMRTSRKTGREGDRGSTSFLLVIPGSAQAVEVGDKVLLGVGPLEVDWLRLVPPLVPGLAVVSHVDVKRWRGEIVHTEAGGSLLRLNKLDQNR